MDKCGGRVKTCNRLITAIDPGDLSNFRNRVLAISSVHTLNCDQTPAHTRTMPHFQRADVTKVKPTALLVVALWIFWGFGYQTVGKRLVSQVDGTVISRRNVAYPVAPARYSTEYIVRGLDGQNHVYVAGPTDASLPRTVPVGTTLKKLRWHWAYEENGQVIDSFGWVFYGVVLAIGTTLLVWSLKLRSQQSRLSSPQ